MQNRVEILIKKCHTKKLPKTPSKSCYRKMTELKCLSKISYKEAAKTTVGKTLSEKELISILVKQRPNKQAAKSNVNDSKQKSRYRCVT